MWLEYEILWNIIVHMFQTSNPPRYCEPSGAFRIVPRGRCTVQHHKDQNKGVEQLRHETRPGTER